MDAFGKLHGLSKSLIYGANLAIEELFINIISHAYEDGREHTIGIGFSLLGRKLTITLEDDGKKFNPTAIPDRPAGGISLEDIQDIDLGLSMVRTLVDDITYERRYGKNIVTLEIEDSPNKRTIVSATHEDRVFPPPEKFRKNARIKSLDEYKEIYQRSIDDPDTFWSHLAEELNWFQKWSKVLVENFSKGVHKWFVGGKLNLAVNCLDRHLSTWRKNKAAIIWEGDTPGEEKTLTYQQLHRQVCRFANVLKKHGVQKGDRVCICLPMIVELPIAMLACARIGAVHSVMFEGLKAESLKDRILDCSPRLLICANGCTLKGDIVKTKEQLDLALPLCPSVTDVIVVHRLDMESPMCERRDFWWDKEIEASDISNDCNPEIMDAEDPLFIHYTGSSTDKPMGILHTTAGYLVYVMQTFKWIFDIRDEDTCWCTADIVRTAGHSYSVYGPLVNGATSVLFEGAADHPCPDRFWKIIEKYSVNIFYTTSTALQSLMKKGNLWPAQHDLSSLRLLGIAGNPVSSKAWIWCHKTIGQERCPIVDTWWQAETGGIVISPLPGAVPCKPGCAALPFFGIQPEIIRNHPDRMAGNEGGWLVIKKPWPGLMRRVYGNPGRFKKNCFTQFPGMYATGDAARTDDDGYFWMTGRNDDVINTPEHGLETAESEHALSHASVAKTAVTGMPSESHLQDIHTFMTLKVDALKRDDLIAALKNPQRAQILYHQNETRSPTFTYQA